MTWCDKTFGFYVINCIDFLYRGAKMISGDDQIFTEVELKTLERVINETRVCTKQYYSFFVEIWAFKYFYIKLICTLLCPCLFYYWQTWKNETVAEQEKRSPTEKPVLLSKDIEAKISLLDREVTYLLNKAKFAKPKPKPKPKDKNSTSSDGKTNSTDSEKVISPKGVSSKRKILVVCKALHLYC